MTLDPEILPIFLKEAEGYLDLLRDAEADLDRRRHAAHGLKGAAALVGLDDVAALALEIQDALASGAPVARTLDRLQRELRGHAESLAPAQPVEEPWDDETARLLLEVFVEEAQEQMESLAEAALALERREGDPTEQVQGMLRTAHTLKGSAATVGQAQISRAAHCLEELLASPQLSRDGDEDHHALADQLLRGCDVLCSMVSAARQGQDQGDWLTQMQDLARAGQGDGDEQEQERRRRERRGQERRQAARRQEDPGWIKIDPARLDQLVDLGGELLIQRTRLQRRVEELRRVSLELATVRRQLNSALSDSRGAGHRAVRERLRELEVDLADRATNLERGSSALVDDCEALRRTGRSLRAQLGQLYLTPISLLYTRLQRTLREMARDQGKQIELVITDESSEMARSVVEGITAPLIHLLRNAVVHGIEQPQERVARGKPPAGRVEISAHHSGGVVYLEVRDDGAGIDPAALRQALREGGHLSDKDLLRLSDEDLLDTTFISGVSTRERADQLAGRGVGLDVVRQHISRLGGDIRLRSTPGAGTRFLIQMPMSTATAQALLFRAADLDLGLPLAHVEQVVLPAEGQVQQDGEGLRLQLEQGALPLLPLERILGPPGHQAAPLAGERPAILIRLGKLRFAVACDRVVGTREIVLKGFGSLLGPHPLLAAATVRSDSSVTFVLDVAFLARAAALAHQGAGEGPDAAQDANERPADRFGPGEGAILLVDDSRSVREAVGHLLRTLGHQVELAADGLEAWEKLRQGRFRLLLTDLEMPEIHGLELITRCRATEAMARMPIVVLTSRSSAFSRLEALKRGAEGFLAKPVSKRILQEQLEKLLT